MTTTSLRTFRNAVLLAVGVMLVLVLVDQGQASAGEARGALIGINLPECDGPDDPTLCKSSGSTSGGTTTTDPQEAPYVYQVSPQDGATGVPRNTNVKVTFSEEMDPSTINSNTIKVTVIYYLYDRYTNYYNYVREVRFTTISKDPNEPSGRTWVVDPTLLRTNSEVEVEIGTGVKDLSDGLSITRSRTYFKTASW